MGARGGGDGGEEPRNQAKRAEGLRKTRKWRSGNEISN